MSDQDERASRRNFLRASALGVGATAAAASSGTFSADLGEPNIPSIRVPDDFEKSLAETEKPGSFEGRGQTGAEVFANLCKQEQLAALFCCPGNYTIINALAAAGIPTYGGRSEGSMCAMADGFSRATGEVTATSGTEGPGFTNMIMNIAAANAARTPLLVLASNMQIAGDDRETRIQTVYQQPQTEGMKKYGKRLIDPKRIHEYGGHAFRHLKTGVPGPVHLDFPAEVSRARFKSPAELKDYFGKDQYRSESRAYPNPADMKSVVQQLRKSERPLIVAGQGVFQRQAWEPLKRFAEKHECAVATSGPTRGCFPDEHRLCVMTAPDALLSADLVIFVGQYCMPSPGEYLFNPEIKAIRVHPEQGDIGRNWPIDLGVVSDEALFLEALADAAPRKRRRAWTDEIRAAKQAYEDQIEEVYQLGLKYSLDTHSLHPAVLGREMQAFLNTQVDDRNACVIGAGGWTSGLFAGRYMRANRPGNMIVPPYQYAAIGPDMAMMTGACAAVQRGVGPQKGYEGAPTFCLSSDAGAAYSLFELDTASKYKLPTINLIYNNNAWGVWPHASRSKRSMHMYLFQENLRYDKLAEGLGANGAYVQTVEELRLALHTAYKLARDEKVSSLINCQGIKEFTSGRAYPPGIAMNPEPGCGAVAH